MESIMKTTPTVFAVGENYQIMMPFAEDAVAWIRIGERCFYDHSNGILRSAVRIHRVNVPGDLLNVAKAYTVCYRRVLDRKPYFPVLEEPIEVEYSFRPVPSVNVRIYQVSDAHGMIDAPVAAARKFCDVYGGIDLLILNGDVIDHSGAVENFEAIYRISEEITHGEIPVIFSRGNHDTRGRCAERLCEYVPLSPTGESYFSFRQGPIWGLLLDCGEDKPDTNEEYNGTVCFSAFREMQEAFLKSLPARAEEEYDAPGVRYRLIVSHMPFTCKNLPPFDIEEARYTLWAALLKEKVRPQLFLAGHKHRLGFYLPGDPEDAFGQPCPVAVFGVPHRAEKTWTGGGCILRAEEILVINNNADEILFERSLPLS